MASEHTPDPPTARAQWITVEGARSNNLRGASVRIPKHRLTVFTGVSGSGKSSLVFDTIAAEARRLVAETYPTFIRNRLPQHPPADVDRVDGLTYTTVVDQRRFTGNARSTVATASDLAAPLRLLFSRLGRPSAGFTPAYSFNDPEGMCPRCEGLGAVDDIDLDQLLDRAVSLRDGAVRFPTFAPGTYRWKRLTQSGVGDPDLPLSRWSPRDLDTILHAEGLRLTNPHPEYPKSGIFDGVLPRLRDAYLRQTPSRLTDAERDALERVVTRHPCPDCGGTRLNDRARASRVDGASIADWSALPVSALRNVVASMRAPEVQPLLAAIRDRLDSLDAVGLGYLSLDRVSSTLSGGEAQRVKIVRHLGSPLSDICYVFDEPSTGLHPHDVHRLLELLTRLRDLNNTILVVEHHPSVIAAADHVIDLGPGAGTDGGTVQYEGSPAGVRDTATATGRVLRAPVALRTDPRDPRDHVTIRHATTHNLRDVTVDVPLGVFTAVTGVAGSGKSSLFGTELPRQHPDFVAVDQAPLRGGTRSTPATALAVAEPIRETFARATGRHPSWFSANARGACPVCKGKGVITTDLAFLDDVRTTCDACDGTRFAPETRAATLGGHSMADVLAMSPAQAAPLFADRPDVTHRLTWMRRVGLGYLTLGQSVDTLSGGERQRLRLARHLGDIGTVRGQRIVVDEPTAGLHGTDVDDLVALFTHLVADGATVIAVEHNQRVIAQADHVIDIGPGAGEAGGTVVFEGPPHQLVHHPTSVTGHHLRLAVS
ncbi:ATP-binding cassette domain-containing protein [Spiractinospora alimapuensis]|uniref:ATP-binding cassette domain-containing protein n=1 Tax=Spiractinospora alimapuensis TaxID=2820884 RepID=UPI001F20D8CF|nr:ATP-binding cassette domain-containing protein [Spiractinospora alimapuensis]QVQ54148.1 ATP-binding cassette domain-containing protein [Spiractinospora alimapuensis]